MPDFIEDYINGVRKCVGEIRKVAVEEAVETILDAYRRNRHIFILGNGGSAATASHFACDLAKGTVIEVRRRIESEGR